MDYFGFLKELDNDLYRRYLLIEESIKNHNSNVYLNMQIYLEHLFKFVSKKQGYNLHTKKKLGEILADYRIENYCHLKIEYYKINVLKAINHYGNKYKHNKILDFNFQQFMMLMQEIYIISIKIFNYYNHIKINQIAPLDDRYYKKLMQFKDIVEDKLSNLETDLNLLSVDLELKEEKLNNLKINLHELKKEIEILKNENKNLRKENIKLEKKVYDLKTRLENKNISFNLMKNENLALKQMIMDEIKNETFQYKIDHELLKKLKMH